MNKYTSTESNLVLLSFSPPFLVVVVGGGGGGGGRTLQQKIMVGRFMSLSTLFKSYGDDGSVIMNICYAAQYSHKLNSASSGIQMQDLLI